MSDVLLACHDLVVGWQRRPLLPPIDMEIRRGHFVAVLGRNGSGKTTWFKTLLGETPPIAGRIERSASLARIAYIPQASSFDRLLPLSAHDVVCQGRLHDNNFLRPLQSHTDVDVVAGAMDKAGVAELAGQRFESLSRGQRQRVMFARMLATEAELALLDEPTAAMDVIAERDAMARLAELAREHGIAVVVISHALDVAERHAHDILFVDRLADAVVFGPRDEVIATDLYRGLRGDTRIDG